MSLEAGAAEAGNGRTSDRHGAVVRANGADLPHYRRLPAALLPRLAAGDVRGLSDLLSKSADGFLITDCHGVIREGNPTAARLLGLDPRFLPGKPLPLYVAGKGRSAFRVEIAQAVEEGGRAWELELAPRHGPPFRATLVAAAFADEQGRTAGLQWLLRTVGEIGERDLRHGAAEPAQASGAAGATAERQAALAEISAVLGASLDLETTLARAARLAVPLLGDLAAIYLLDEAGNARRAVLAHVNGEREAEIAALWDRYPLQLATSAPLRQALESGTTRVQNAIPDPACAEATNPPAQLPYWRALHAHAVICVPLRTRGRLLGAIAFISEERGKRYDRAEVALAEEIAHRAAIAIENARLYAETQRAVRLRDEFLASISHDLRSPLATVKGSAQLLRRRLAQLAQTEPDAAFARQLAEGIIGAAATMAELIDQLLDLARQDARQPLALDLKETDLAALARAAVESARAVAAGQRIVLTLPPAPLLGRWDPLRLRRVLDNLVGNAVKYGADGDVRVWVTSAVAAADEEAVLSVADRGIGIPAADLPHIFERFHRGANVVGQIPGTGIGLAGTRQIVEAHGGTITIESVEGEGTTVTVRLPLDPHPRPLANA